MYFNVNVFHDLCSKISLFPNSFVVLMFAVLCLICVCLFICMFVCMFVCFFQSKESQTFTNQSLMPLSDYVWLKIYIICELKH